MGEYVGCGLFKERDGAENKCVCVHMCVCVNFFYVGGFV